MYSINKQEYDHFWSERERAGSYDPYLRPSIELIAILKGLRPLPGVDINYLGKKGEDSEQLHPKDSEELLDVGKPRRDIEIAMLQLRNMTSPTKPEEKKLEVIWNNLGCAYALLERYNEAREALERASELAERSSSKAEETQQEESNPAEKNKQRSVILSNLGSVYALLERYSEAREVLQQAIELVSLGKDKKDFKEKLAMVNRMAKR